MASAPMAPVSVSKGGMESNLLLFFVFIVVVVVVLVICSLAPVSVSRVGRKGKQERLLLNMIMIVVNFGC